MEKEKYIPGVCNIGKAEIERRSSKLKLGIILLVVITFLFLYLPYAAWLFSILIGLACYNSILIFQIRQKFCIAFGMFSVFNFDALSSRKVKVESNEYQRLDRLQVVKILAFSMISTLIFVGLIFLLKKII